MGSVMLISIATENTATQKRDDEKCNLCSSFFGCNRKTQSVRITSRSHIDMNWILFYNWGCYFEEPGEFENSSC